MLRNGRTPDNKFSAKKAFNHALRNSTPMPPDGVVTGAARLHQRSSTFPLEARMSLALALLGGRRSSCLHRPESVRYCGVLKLSVQIPGRSLQLATVPTLERFVRTSRPEALSPRQVCEATITATASQAVQA